MPTLRGGCEKQAKGGKGMGIVEVQTAVLGVVNDQASMASRISITRGMSWASVQERCTFRVGRRGGGLSHAKDNDGSR